jgi:hypothetical protein
MFDLADPASGPGGRNAPFAQLAGTGKPVASPADSRASRSRGSKVTPKRGEIASGRYSGDLWYLGPHACTVVNEQVACPRPLAGWLDPVSTVGHPDGRREFPGDWELSMSNRNTRRVIRQAARFAVASGGICLFLSLPAKQAQAATGGQPSLLSGLTSGVSDVVQAVTGPVTGVLGSVVNSGSEPVTGTASAATQAPTSGNQVTPTASAVPQSQPATPGEGQASPVVTAAPSSPAATSHVPSTGAATRAAAPKVSRTRPLTASVRPTAQTSRVTAPAVAAVSHAPTPVTEMAIPAAGTTVRTSASATIKPAAVSSTPSARPSARPSATQSHRPISDILAPVSGMPRWLEDVLLAAGLLAATAYATEPVAVLARRRRQRTRQRGIYSAKRRKGRK